MKSLLAIEWMKIRKYRTFWVLVCLYLFLVPFWNYEIVNGVINLGAGAVNLLNTAYSFPDVWGNLGFWGSIFILFVSILVIILTTNEFTYRTHRQNVIDGWSKMQFYHSKVLLVISLSLVATVYHFLLGAIFGYVKSGSFTNLFTDFHQVLYFFVLSLNYLGFAMLLGLLMKRSGFAIGLFLLYSLIIEISLKFWINAHVSTPWGNLLPLQSSDELLPFQLMQMMQAMRSKMGNVVPEISARTYVLVSLGWCTVYYLLGRLLLKKRDW